MIWPVPPLLAVAGCLAVTGALRVAHAGPADRDGDGVADERDRCPARAGLGAQGCPPEDRDGDGVLDGLDACADSPGPEDNRGCPDTDGDGDLVVDRVDRCPDSAGRVHYQGCEPPDADGDGVLDADDRCPDSAEVFNGNRDGDGCPDAGGAQLEVTGRVLLVRLSFDARDQLTAVDRRVVRIAAAAAAQLEARAVEVTVVAPYGLSYGDSIGRARRRALSVVTELLARRVAEGRVEGSGRGPDGQPRVELRLR